jgi:hypothetical protein
MRFLRGRWFLLGCLGAVLLGLAAGSGWLRPLFGLMDRPLETAGLKVPAVLRLTTAEQAGQEKRLAAAFGGKRPKTYAFVELEPYLRVKSPRSCGGSHFALDNGKPLPDDCNIIAIGPAHRVLLAESHAKTETVFQPRRVTVDAETNSWAAFFLGRDGKAKILVWVWGSKSPFKEMAVIDANAFRRIDMKRMDGDGYVFLGDDPGPLAGKSIAPRLSFSGVRRFGDGQLEPLGDVFIDADAAERFRYYAALQGKPYDPEDWMPRP